jgi:hypothetical protein
MVVQIIKLSQKQKEGLETFVSDHILSCHIFMEDPDSKNFNPYDSRYCGCDVCETKEYLMATFGYLEKMNILKIEDK